MLGALRVVSRARAHARPGPVVRRLRRRRDHGSLPAGGRRRPSRQPSRWAGRRRSFSSRGCATARRPPMSSSPRSSSPGRAAARRRGERHARRRRAGRHHASGRDPGRRMGQPAPRDLGGERPRAVGDRPRGRGRRPEASGGRAAIVDVDLCILDDAQAARARSIVAQAAGVPAESVAVGTTHNHSVPVTLELGGAWIRRNRELVEPYVESVFEAIGHAAAEAAASTAPRPCRDREGALAARGQPAHDDARRARRRRARSRRRLGPHAHRRPPRRRRRPARRHDRPLRLPSDHPRTGQHVRDTRVPGHREARRRGRGRRALPLRPGSVRRRRAERAVRGRPRDLPAGSAR